MTLPAAFSRTLETQHGTLALPVFLPDATRAVVRAIDSADLEHIGIEGLVMSAFHLMQHPGSTTVKALGGLHAMSGWRGPIITDSGGFQAYSLIRENAKNGSLSDKGIVFRPQGGKDKILLTPEKSIQLQLSYGADIVICLDDCTHADDGPDAQRDAVQRTIAWARRCKHEFEKLTAAGTQRPLLFGVIQGGNDQALRKQCAEALLEIGGFDGFGFGGYPLDGDGALLTDVLAYTRNLVPSQYSMHALGIGHPRSVVTCTALGYGIFDCALPTRDARRGRLMAWNSDPATVDLNTSDWFSYVYIGDDKHIKATQPICAWTDSPAQRYSRGYLHHLHAIEDAAYLRLGTLHNLRFMTLLLKRLRDER
jgi:queuine tRNA-ribosyltransferase